MSILLNLEQQNELRHRYLNNDLFRHWSFILCRLERSYKEINPVSIWCETDRLIKRLYDAGKYGDAEIPYIQTELIEKHGKKVAVTLMTVLFTRLANAAKSEKASDYNLHKPLCISILREIENEPLFEDLINLFKSQKLDNNGNKVYIQPCDPMNADAALSAMDKTAKEEMDRKRTKVTELTSGLKVFFKEDWNIWEAVWNDICIDTDLMQLLAVVTPRNTVWGLNEKMVCNVIGIFLNVRGYKNFVSKINSVLLPAKNRRDYITYYDQNGGSSAVFSNEQRTRIENIIRSKIST